MDTIQSFVSTLILNAVHHAAPNLTADDDARIVKGVNDLATTAMDLVTVILAIHNAKAAAPAAK